MKKASFKALEVQVANAAAREKVLQHQQVLLEEKLARSEKDFQDSQRRLQALTGQVMANRLQRQEDQKDLAEFQLLKAQVKSWNNGLGYPQAAMKAIVDYNLSKKEVVEDIEYCRFLWESANPEIAEMHAGLKQLVLI